MAQIKLLRERGALKRPATQLSQHFSTEFDELDRRLRKYNELNLSEKIMNPSSDNPSKADLRIYLNRRELLEWENQIRLQRHIERYALLRQFARGVVCDAACGCGYGSYLLSTNPDVQLVIGVDADPDTISYAREEYGTEKTKFHASDLGQWVCDRKIDMLISVETIEHLQDKSTLPNFVARNSINHLIITYPSKKTTHYNPYHYYDFKLEDILKLFSDFTCYRHFNWKYEFDVVFLLKNPN